MSDVYKHVTRDIEVKVLERGDEYVKFEIVKYDKGRFAGLEPGQVDVLDPHRFHVLFNPKEDS